MVSFQRITLSFLLVSGALFAYLIPYGAAYLRHNHHALAGYAYRNRQLPVGAYEHQDHPNLREDHQ